MASKKSTLKHGDRIYEIRTRHGLSQLDLAELLEISKETVSKIERDISFLQADKALILYREYGYSFEWIYGIDNTEYTTDPRFCLDFRNCFSIRNAKTLFLNGDKISSQSRPLVKITLSKEQIDYLQTVSNLEDLKKRNTLSEDQYEALIYKAEETYKNSFPSHIYTADIPVESMEELVLNRYSGETIPSYIP